MSKALAKRPSDKLKTLVNQPSVQEQFKNAMGKHSDLFVASLIDVFNSGLQDCEPGLVIQEALKSAVLKLPISKALGFAYIIPYNKKYKDGNQWKSKKIPQFQLGYKGMTQLAMRSGQVANLNADVAYEGEYKSFDKLTGLVDLTGERKSFKVVGAFVYLELINGFKKSEYWSKDKILAHAQAHSQSYQSDLKYKTKKSPWLTDFDAMAKKTVLKSVLSKYAPLSVDFIAATNYDPSFVEMPTQLEDMEIYEDKPKTPPPSKMIDHSEKPEEPKEETQTPTEAAPLKKLEYMSDSHQHAEYIKQCIEAGDFTESDLERTLKNKDEQSAEFLVDFIESRMKKDDNKEKMV